MAATAVRTKCSSSPARTEQKTSAGNGWAPDAAGARSTDTNGHFQRKNSRILPFRFRAHSGRSAAVGGRSAMGQLEPTHRGPASGRYRFETLHSGRRARTAGWGGNTASAPRHRAPRDGKHHKIKEVPLTIEPQPV